MYQVQDTPDPVAHLDTGSDATPLVTLKDEHGGVAHIIDDDNCLVLILEYADGTFAGLCRMVSHWFPEAAQALVALKEQRSREPDRYSVERYWIYDDPIDWGSIRLGELFMIKQAFGHPEREGVVYRKCNHQEGQDSLGNVVSFDPGGLYTTLKPKKTGEQPPADTLDEQAERLEKELSAALNQFPASCSSACTAPMTVKTFGDGLDRLVIGIKEHFKESGAKEGLLGKVTVRPNHNRTVDKRFFAQVTFDVPPEDSIRNRTYPWVSLLDHRADALNPGAINDAIDVLRLDAPGAGRACHDYVVLSGIHGSDKHWTDESHEQLRRDIQNRSYPIYQNDRVTVYALRYSDEGVTRYAVVGYDRQGEAQCAIKAAHASLIRFQNGAPSQVGLNGVTHEALLTVLLDRLRGFQAGPKSCRENACALTHLEEALMWLQRRGKRTMQAGMATS